MKILDYEFWKDPSAVLIYFFVAVSLITSVIDPSYLIATCIMGFSTLSFCILQMVLHKIKQN